MSAIFAAISQCLGGRPRPAYSIIVMEKSSRTASNSHRSDQEIANEILYLLFNASQNDPNLEFKIQTEVSACGWEQGLAERVFNGLQSALRNGTPMGEAVKIAFEKSVTEVYKFAKEHPVYFAIIALGILVLLAPWALEALGFAELGPIEDEFLNFTTYVELLLYLRERR